MSNNTSPPKETETGPIGAAYRVLARKYRPDTFSRLIGQEALVRTLTNAIQTGRLAHAFILTGIRGVGKTTAARIIARALNCIGPAGGGGPTPAPCGECEHCRAIAEDRHVDVLEMDAASRTGVDNMRELIDGVRYRPTLARFKVYIIDEVHMLSRSSFNALLKTLEEPPEHVKFIFATTEIRKVPVTVLSRCQRFDLRRVEAGTLAEHFKVIAGKEGAAINDAALALIAAAADGSVRDGLSLLDQAITDVAGEVGEDQVRAMLGLADRGRIFTLLEAVMAGDLAKALELFERLYAEGADPARVLEDLLDITHWLTRIKITPGAAVDPATPEIERVRGRDMAGKLPMAALARSWQMLLKGLAEVRSAPRPAQAAEMVLVRLAYTAELPSPADALKALADAAPPASVSPPPPVSPPASAPPRPTVLAGGSAVASAPKPDPITEEPPDLESLEDVVELAGLVGERILRSNLVDSVHLVRFEPGRIEFRPADKAPPKLANELTTFLGRHTDRRWVVLVSREPGLPTLRQAAEEREAAEKVSAAKDPLVRAVLDAFPGAKIEAVRRLNISASRERCGARPNEPVCSHKIDSDQS
ncbi:MAG TPA: DNA polymerase III subunit gamma/tau [Alphaproteobacteria bacterium]|nr:DNA polymerase III subunit gamma/tau [Alphaproteobacteria bacterium]